MHANFYDDMISYRDVSGKFVSYKSFKNAFLDSFTLITPQRLEEILSGSCHLDEWVSLLREKTRADVKICNADNEFYLVQTGSVVGEVLFESLCYCFLKPGLTKSGKIINGIQEIQQRMEASNVKSCQFRWAYLMVFATKIFVKVLPELSLELLGCVCACFSKFHVNPKKLLPLPPTAVVDHLSQVAGINFSSLYRQYFLSYLLHWKNTVECPFVVLSKVGDFQRDALEDLENQTVLEAVEKLLQVLLGTSSVLALQASFLICRILKTEKYRRGCFADDEKNIVTILFQFCSQRFKRSNTHFLVSMIFKSLRSVGEEDDEEEEGNLFYLINSWYLKGGNVDRLVAHLRVEEGRENRFVGEFVVPTCLKYCRVERSMMHQNGLFNRIFELALSNPVNLQDLLAIMLELVKNVSNIRAPKNLVALFSVLAQNSNEEDSHLVFDIVIAFLSQDKETVKMFSPPDKTRSVWKFICELCRGENVGFTGNVTDTLPEDEDSSSSMAMSSSEDRNASGPLDCLSRGKKKTSNSVCRSVNRMAWEFVLAYVRAVSNGISSLIKSRFFGTLLSAIGPRSAPFVASNGLICLSHMISSSDQIKSSELKQFTSLLSEKRFNVQVHLLYKKQEGADVNLFALSSWATRVLGSSLAKDLVGRAEDAQYKEELLEIQSFSVLSK
jgi:hypothetical protein